MSIHRIGRDDKRADFGEPAAETLFLIQAQLKNEIFNRYVVDRIRTAAKMFAG